MVCTHVSQHSSQTCNSMGKSKALLLSRFYCEHSQVETGAFGCTLKIQITIKVLPHKTIHAIYKAIPMLQHSLEIDVSSPLFIF
jgi:hypothetical protein